MIESYVGVGVPPGGGFPLPAAGLVFQVAIHSIGGPASVAALSGTILVAGTPTGFGPVPIAAHPTPGVIALLGPPVPAIPGGRLDGLLISGAVTAGPIDLVAVVFATA
jgi:hypothetical protein